MTYTDKVKKGYLSRVVRISISSLSPLPPLALPTLAHQPSTIDMLGQEMVQTNNNNKCKTAATPEMNMIELCVWCKRLRAKAKSNSQENTAVFFF